MNAKHLFIGVFALAFLALVSQGTEAVQLPNDPYSGNCAGCIYGSYNTYYFGGYGYDHRYNNPYPARTQANGFHTSGILGLNRGVTYSTPITHYTQYQVPSYQWPRYHTGHTGYVRPVWGDQSILYRRY